MDNDVNNNKKRQAEDEYDTTSFESADANHHKGAQNFQSPQWCRPHHPHHPLLGGLIIILIGIVLLLKRLPQTAGLMPSWLYTWPVILIVIGIFIGVKHRFRNGLGWIIPVVIGLVFLLKDEFILSEVQKELILPVLVIIAGIIVLLRRNRHRRYMSRFPFEGHPAAGLRHHRMRRRGRAQFTENSTEDVIDINSNFGNVVKNVVSKKFQGGNINCSFGGVELDLSQSDLPQTVTLNLSVTFGGVEITVPSNWKIKNDISVLFGGVEDKRKKISDLTERDQTLVLTGNITCGGLEIKN